MLECAYWPRVMDRKLLKILHTSDVHIGSDTYPREALEGLEKVLSMADSLAVDALLIAGDLFDRATVPNKTVQYVFSSLSSLKCPVVVLPGNHDTLLTSDSFEQASGQSGVNVIRDPAGEMLTFKGLTLSVWGRPVYQHVPSFHPIGQLPARPDKGWYIAIGHGIVLDSSSFEDRGSPISHEELAKADCDYIALGHTHVFRDVTKGKASAFYSGAPSGGQEKTVALVNLDPANGVTTQRLRVS